MLIGVQACEDRIPFKEVYEHARTFLCPVPECNKDVAYSVVRRCLVLKIGSFCGRPGVFYC